MLENYGYVFKVETAAPIEWDALFGDESIKLQYIKKNRKLVSNEDAKKYD